VAFGYKDADDDYIEYDVHMTEATNTLTRALAEIDAEIAATEETLGELRLQKLGAVALMRRVGVPVPVDSSALMNRGDGVSQDRPVIRRVPTPGNADLVAKVLRQTGQALSLTEIKDTLSRNGHDLAADQVRSSVTYLRRKKRAEPVTRGYWRLCEESPQNAEDADATTASASSGTSELDQEGGTDFLDDDKHRDSYRVEDHRDSDTRWQDQRRRGTSVVDDF